jgi:glycine/D-amino acid oxidase-like deaminating enzyme
VRGRVRAEVFEPFKTRVLAEDRGSTSATFTRLLVRSFALGTPGVPARGMSVLPGQIAADLVTEVLLGVEVTDVRQAGDGWRVTTSQGEHGARAVVVATDAVTADRLVGVAAPAMKGLVTYWFATDAAPTDLDFLLLDPTRTGPVVNTAVMTNVAPDYAPPGRHLVQATTLAGDATERDVRAQLARMYRTSTRRWQVVVRHDVQQALPEQVPGVSLRQPVDLGEGLFVAGDHRDTASIQGALVSGRRTAAAVRSRLAGLSPAPGPRC